MIDIDGHKLSVRELEYDDINSIVSYWINSDKDFMVSMGVDLSKIPSAEDLTAMLKDVVSQPYEDKKSYCIIWLLNGTPIGHCNVNKIVFGQDAYMHLHIWKAEDRQKGYGASFIRLALPYFFKNLHLKNLYSEPYAFNPAPNKTLEKIGFHFIKEYTTTPGWINFEQSVNLWGINKI